MRHDTSSHSNQPIPSPQARAQHLMAELCDPRQTAQPLPPLGSEAEAVLARLLAEGPRPSPPGLKARVQQALAEERARLAAEAAPAAAPAARGRRARVTWLRRAVAAAAGVAVVATLSVVLMQPPGAPNAPTAAADEVGLRFQPRRVLGPDAPEEYGAAVVPDVPPVRTGEPIRTEAEPTLLKMGSVYILVDRNGEVTPHRNFKVDLQQGRMAVVTRQPLRVASPHGELVISPHRRADGAPQAPAAAVIYQAATVAGEPVVVDGRVVAFEQRMVPIGELLPQAARVLEGEIVVDEALRYAPVLTQPMSLWLRDVSVPDFAVALQRALQSYGLDLRVAEADPAAGKLRLSLQHFAAESGQAAITRAQPVAWLTAVVRCGTVTLRPTEASGNGNGNGNGREANVSVSVAEPRAVPRMLRVLADGQAVVGDGSALDRWPATIVAEFARAPSEIRASFLSNWRPAEEQATARPADLAAFEVVCGIHGDAVLVRHTTTGAWRVLRTGDTLANWRVEWIAPGGVQFAEAAPAAGARWFAEYRAR